MLDLTLNSRYNQFMDITGLVMAHIQRPLYLIPLGSHFSVDFPVQTYSDIMQKNHECLPPHEDGADREIYVGDNSRYVLTPRSLVTLIDYNGQYWYGV